MAQSGRAASPGPGGKRSSGRVEPKKASGRAPIPSEIARETDADGRVVIRPVGSIDAHNFDQMERILTEVFQEGNYQVVVDLTGVDFVSSAGAGVFIGAMGEAKEKGGYVQLVNPTAHVREVFDILGLSKIFPENF